MSGTQKRTYLADRELNSAVQTVLALGLPLLVTGEPGTGKTQLAHHIARDILDTDLLIFNTKTTSKAKDLLYKYNALKHFRDSQAGQTDLNPMNYVSFEAMGKAILESGQRRYVVLIDEVDKAPRDFPNDILHEFENMAFGVEEAAREELDSWNETRQQPVHINDFGLISLPPESLNRPVLVLTSNSEKTLPDAFLRRCAYYHIPFPSRERLIEIVQAHVPLSEAFAQNMLPHAITHFLDIRKMGLRKNPATAELLSWIHVLQQNGIDVKQGIDGSSEEVRQKLTDTYLLLVKNREDRERITKQV